MATAGTGPAIGSQVVFTDPPGSLISLWVKTNGIPFWGRCFSPILEPILVGIGMTVMLQVNSLSGKP